MKRSFINLSNKKNNINSLKNTPEGCLVLIKALEDMTGVKYNSLNKKEI